MKLYEIEAHYPTQGENAYEWGAPEGRVEELLEEHSVTVVGYDFGTSLLTGDRDAWLEVEARSLFDVEAALSGLPSSERALWTVKEAEEA